MKTLIIILLRTIFRFLFMAVKYENQFECKIKMHIFQVPFHLWAVRVYGAGRAEGRGGGEGLRGRVVRYLRGAVPGARV